MADSPDWITDVQVTVIVENTPVPSTPANEWAITRLDRLTVTLAVYDTVASWTVTAGRVGILQFVEMETDNYDITSFRLTIAGVVQFTGAKIGGSLALEWPCVKLAAGSVVLLEAMSDGITEVNVDGDILGKEVG